MSFSEKFQKALDRFDSINAEDPVKEIVDGREQPHELIDAHRLHAWVLKLRPEASEALQLASRCQHLARWKIPRKDYPQDRAGYLKWRSDLKLFHADQAARVIEAAGYDESMTRKVRALNLKQNLKTDPDAQTLEDALCLVFLENELDGFAKKYDEAKLTGILQKTWKKMSEEGRRRALALKYSDAARELLDKALGGQN